MMSTGGLDTVGSPAFTDEESARYYAAVWWSDMTLSDAVARNAEQFSDADAGRFSDGLLRVVERVARQPETRLSRLSRLLG